MSDPTEGEIATMEVIRERKQAYELSCGGPGMQRFLIDLAAFCRAAETCVVKDEQGRVDEAMTKILEGRREVWLRIQEHLNLTNRQLYCLYTGQQFNPGEEHG